MHIENNSTIATKSFFYGKPAEIYLQALEPCYLACISRSKIKSLENQIPYLKEIKVEMYEEALANFEERQKLYLINKPIDRYKYFVKYYPKLANRIPLNIIASFLDIHPSTLSIARAEKCF